MLTLHLEAASHIELIAKACIALGMQRPAPEPEKAPAAVPSLTAPAPLPAAPPTNADTSPALPVDKVAAAVSSPETPPAPTKRRGRPPAVAKPVEEPKAAAPVAQAPIDSGVSHPASAPAAAAPAPVTYTHDDVKALLQKVAARKNGEGLEDASKIIAESGYTKVKDIKPEHFAVIAGKCTKLLTPAAA